LIHLLRTSRKSKGFEIITGESSVEEYETICCVHCRHHWRLIPGSGKNRGWCNHCFGPTCGAKQCDTCVPYMKMIEQCESIYMSK